MALHCTLNLPRLTLCACFQLPCICTGGCGKTTLAKLLFNRLAPHFPYSALIELQPDGRIGSQQLSNLLKQLGAAGFNEASSAGVLLGRLQEYVYNKAVLIVVDNVWRKGHLDELLPRRFGQGAVSSSQVAHQAFRTVSGCST
eukprot:GHUV01053511.1.p2 GENE.GHUV01053511.1~~GHUV01053511.1.p2  ORF type:complete len:143 (-),score=29.59 GHUV01053511.1:789-1217(-)